MKILAAACSLRGIHCTGFSSDLVFDGLAGRPYVERDLPRPLCAYGRSKLEAERTLAAHGGLSIRTAAFFSPFDEHNFAVAVVRALTSGARFSAASDHAVSPTYVPHLADAVLDLVIDGERGTFHLTSGETVSWAAFARRLAEACSLDQKLIDGVPGHQLGWTAPRPAVAALASERRNALPALDIAIGQFAAGICRAAPRRCAPPVTQPTRPARPTDPNQTMVVTG
jgi:dTDP-4-dehydrorhamnose reductase